MAYEKQDWTKFVWKEGQDNFQSMLNHMENGIANAGGGGGDSVWESGTGNDSIQQKNTLCEATGNQAVAKGLNTHAGATASSSEGALTATRNDYDEATETGFDAAYSHVEGLNNGVNNVAEHGEGKYGWSYYVDNHDPAKSSIHYVGVGTNNQEEYRKNAEVIMCNGDKYVLGVGGYDGKNIENAKTIQQVINESSTGLIIVVQNLNLENFDESEKTFSGSADDVYLPDDFFTNPFKYNLIATIHGNSDDMGTAGYTANHFCYTTGGINMWLCGDKFSFGDGMIDHLTSLVISEEKHLEISYLGLMEPESGDRSQGDTLIKDCYATVLLQKLY